MSEPVGLRLHEDTVLFREAVNFTAAKSGFSTRLVEKDYFCTVLLAYFAGNAGANLIFKGGTCLAKVHADFYRLSEDLDFTISVPADVGRFERRRAVAPLKSTIAAVAQYLPVFTLDRPLRGANNSTQYNGSYTYLSPTTGLRETLLIEVSVREPLLLPVARAPAGTLLLHPISEEPAVDAILINCISPYEAIAEKFRAALTRKDIAIRDFYDIDYAVQRLGVDPLEVPLIDLIRRKLAVPGNPPLNVDPARLALLEHQLDARLKVVLRTKDFQAFDLQRSVAIVKRMAERLQFS